MSEDIKKVYAEPIVKAYNQAVSGISVTDTNHKNRKYRRWIKKHGARNLSNRKIEIKNI